MLRPSHTNARHHLLICATAMSLVACRSGQAPPATTGAPDLALSGLAGQRVVVLPTYAVNVATDLDWKSGPVRPRDLRRVLDDEIAAALRDRGASQGWTFPEALQQSYKRNSSYGADPYALAEEPLRSPGLLRAARLTEPFASQIRTLVALHEDVRLLLAPVELRFERAAPGMGRAALKLVLLDARGSDVRWIGEVKSDSAAAYGPALLADVASRLADLVGK
jgi:hypothetical protein